MFWQKSDEQRARDIAVEVCSQIFSGLGTFSAMAQKHFQIRVNEEAQFEAAIELAVFLLHLVDRRAFRMLGPQRRAEFMDRAITETLNQVTGKINSSHAIRFVEKFGGVYSTRPSIYSRYPEVQAEGQSPSASYPWQAAKVMAEALNLDYEPTSVVYGHLILSDLMVQVYKSKTYRSVR